MSNTEQFRRTDGLEGIRAVLLRAEVDINPDLSNLGEYVSEPVPGCIDRQEEGSWSGSRHEFRYWVPSGVNSDAGLDEGTYNRQDFERAEAYNRQEWYELGLWAEARVTVRGVVQTIRSGGVWGIASDSGDSETRATLREQVDELRDILAELGFSGDDFDAAVLDEVAHDALRTLSGPGTVADFLATEDPAACVRIYRVGERSRLAKEEAQALGFESVDALAAHIIESRRGRRKGAA